MTTVVEGEVVETAPRRIERNAARTPEVLPPDVHTKVSALQRLDGESQARAVTVMLNHARTGLLTAIAAQDLPQIVEWKQKAAAIQEIAKQVRLGKDMQMDAAEFLRRAERGLGVAIRDGQERGEVETTSEGKSRGAFMRDDLLDKQIIKPKPTDFAKARELSGNATHGDPGIYGMTDGVSDAQFAEALGEARDEGNLSRANVARKCKAKAKPVIDADDPLIDADVEPAPKPVRKTAGARKVMTDLVVSMSGLAFIVKDTDPAEVDLESHRGDIESIRQDINVIRRFLKSVEEN